jgi:gliding motility-associated lipoprotein GldB
MDALLHNKPIKQIYLFFSIALLFTACAHDKKVDVSNIPVNINVLRFDHDFDAMRTKPMAQQSQILKQRYGAFYQDFIEQILHAGKIRDTAYFATLRQVFKNRAYFDLKQEVDSIYPNTNKLNEELTDAFRRIKYYFPQKHIPQIYAYFSGFGAQTSIGDNYFAVGLDLFLGADSKFYPAIVEEYPHYMSVRFTPQNVTPRVVEGFVREDMYPEKDSDKTLLSKMVYAGKVMYFMDKVLPDTPDSLKIGYTTKQLKWCDDYKGQIWAFILDQDLLYESDLLKTEKYINEGPFTSGLGEHNESAPKVGVYTGWQIVRQYMDKHPEVSLAQLMADDDAQKILNESKYRPK